MTKIIGIIPARYASTRFPGKPLVDIAGKMMIQRVYEQASKCKSLTDVIVATDDERILNAIQGIGGKAEMTDSRYKNGTERCAEVASRNPADYYINIQGDEPFIKPEQIDTLSSILDGQTELGTLLKKVEDPAVLTNPNNMKVVINKQGEALYFSRQCIPYLRDIPEADWVKRHTFYKHIGIYAYRTDILEQIVKLPTSTLEKAESLEQLRWLENGYSIKTALTDIETIGIDAPEDVARALKQEGLA